MRPPTDSHFRIHLRGIAPKVGLYTHQAQVDFAGIMILDTAFP